MDAVLQKTKFNYQLEALRGFAAIAVVIYHITNQKDLFDRDYFNPSFLAFEPSGHLCVSFFFMLSGYVIGISNPGRLSLGQIIPYIKKRLVRIYPIYLISIVFSFLIALHSYPFTTILSNLLFTQGMLTAVVIENTPAWSLNYEVIYYAMFIPVSFFRMNPGILIVLVIGLGIVNFYLYPSLNAPIISSYAWGFSFWLFGLWAAWLFKNNDLPTRAALLVSNLLLLIAVNKYDTTSHMLKFVTLHVFKTNLIFSEHLPFYQIAIKFVDISDIPYFLILLLLFSNTKFKYRRAVLIIFQLLPAFSLLILIPYFRHLDPLPIIIPGIFYLISTLLLISKSDSIDRLCIYIIKAFVWLGGISYGVYIIHFPLLVLIGRLNVFHGLVLNYFFKSALLIAATILFAYLLEKVFQPWAKSLLTKRPLEKKNRH